MNKKYHISIAALLTALSAPATSAEEQTSPYDECKIIGEFARSTMAARQRGVPITDMMSNDGNELVDEITIEAYKKPRYTSEGYQEKEIVEYQNNWYLGCVHSVKSSMK